MTLLRKTSAVILGCLLVMGGLGASAQAEVSPYSDGVPGLIARYVEFARAVDYVQTLEIEQGAQYVQAVQAQQEADRQRELNTVHISTATSVTRGSGGHSDLWWQGVANCEQGGRNDSYYGYFSYMDGSAAGLTWDQQVAKANSTLNQYSERISQGGAWADACVDRGYQYSPSG